MPGLEPDYWQMPRPPDRQEIIFGAIATGESNDQVSFRDPQLSPDGTTLAHWNWEPSNTADGGAKCGTRLHLRDLASGAELPLRFDPTEGGLMLKFSPDGTKVVFEGTTDGGVTQLMVYAPLDGGGPSVQIGPSYGNASRYGFDFSPDGTNAILSMNGKTRLIDIATDATIELMDSPDGPPSWQRLAR